MKLAFITGITGQDGSYLADFLVKKNYVVVGITRNASKKNLFRLIKLKIIKKSYFNNHLIFSLRPGNSSFE